MDYNENLHTLTPIDEEFDDLVMDKTGKQRSGPMLFLCFVLI